LEDFLKKTLGLLIVGFILFGSCSAQNSNVQNDAKRIVGTWKFVNPADIQGSGRVYVFIFNSDETFTYSSIRQDFDTFENSGTYFISGSNLILKEDNTFISSFVISTYYLSTNRLVITNLPPMTYHLNSLWLEKQ
jgi:hypothetical protein